MIGLCKGNLERLDVLPWVMDFSWYRLHVLIRTDDYRTPKPIAGSHNPHNIICLKGRYEFRGVLGTKGLYGRPVDHRLTGALLLVGSERSTEVKSLAIREADNDLAGVYRFTPFLYGLDCLLCGLLRGSGESFLTVPPINIFLRSNGRDEGDGIAVHQSNGHL